MTSRFFKILILIILPLISYSQTKTIAEKLGYKKNAKLLIVHADDLAVSHSENEASFTAMKKGMVTSASIIVPGPWLLEVARYKKQNPEADLGIHLALTSEWVNFKWRPTTNVPSLVDSNGYFYDNCDELSQSAKIEEVEKELRNQIELAKRNGIQPTHLDLHMGCMLYSNIEYFKLYLKLGRENKIPVLLSDGLSEEYRNELTENDIVLDHVYSAGAQHFDQVGGLDKRYTEVLKNLKPGIHALIIHAAYDNDEMQNVTFNKKYWASKWRQDDFNFFTSDKCKQILKEENIKLVTWREVGKLLKN